MRLLLLPLFLCGCELIVHFDPPPETGDQCGDNLDNDGDGKVDCDDDGCAAFAACLLPRCGDGNIDPPNPRLATAVDLPVAAQAVAAGDFDGDGRADLLVVAGGAVTLLRNTGGAFSAGTPITVGGTLVALAVGDLDQDGDLDAVVVDRAGNQIVALTNARGVLTPGAPVTVGLSPRGVVLFDFDRDGDLDAATADGVDFDGGTTLENMGGVLVVRSTLQDAGPVAAIGAADLNGDRELDLVAALPGNDEVRAFRNSDGGFFGFAGSAPAGTMPTSLVVVDINGDRRPDVVTAGFTTGSLSLLITDAVGNLGSGMSLPVPGATGVTGLAAGDFDRDGIDDLVVATGARLVLFIGNGSTGFTAGAEASLSSNAGAPVSLFADGDARLDVAAPLSSGAVAVVNGNGEECDDGNRVNGDACLSDCTLPGTPLFAVSLGGALLEQATDLAVDADDNVYVVGSFQDALSVAGGRPIPSQGGSDLFVASFTPQGTLRWLRTFGGAMDDLALGVAVPPRGGEVAVVGQAGPADFGSAGRTTDPEQAYALFLSDQDGSPFFLTPFTGQGATGSIGAVAYAGDGRALVGGRFDGTVFVNEQAITGPAAFVADLSGFFQTLSGAGNDVVRLRAAGPNVAALLSFAGTVPELDLTSDGARDLAVLLIQPDNELVRADHLGGSGDTIPGDLAACLPFGLFTVTSFDGAFAVGGLTAQGSSDIAAVRADLEGNLVGAAVSGPGADTASSAVCDPRQNLLIGGSVAAFDRVNAVGSFGLDGQPIWGLPSAVVPLRMARDSRGFVWIAGTFAAAVTWGQTSLTPFGGSDGVLAKLRP